MRQFKTVGGAEKIMRCLAGHLHAAGHDVHVYTYTAAASNGVKVSTLASPRLPRSVRDWSTGWRLAHALNHAPADVTMGEQKTWGADVIRPGGGVEEEYWRAHTRFTHSPLPRQASPKYYFDVRAERNGYQSPRLRRVIVNSRMLEQQLLLHYPYLAGKTVVIHNGAEPKTYDPAARERARMEFAARYPLDATAITLLFAGHEFKRKGLREAIEAVAKARASGARVQLLVAGRDRPTPYLRMCDRLGVRSHVFFLGAGQDIEASFAASDALLLPTYYDPFANVTIEAMSAGLPVITTRQNGGHELVERDAGWIMDEPTDQQTVFTAIQSLSNESARTANREAALSIASKHRLVDKMRAIERVLLEVAEEKRHDKGVA